MELGEPYLPGFEFVEVRQSIPTSGGGSHPIRAWEDVDGATSYTVIVFDGDGAPWWSWQGVGTEVVIGGFATEAQNGPRAGPGVTWVVFAFDVDGSPMGVSPRRSLDS